MPGAGLRILSTRRWSSGAGLWLRGVTLCSRCFGSVSIILETDSVFWYNVSIGGSVLTLDEYCHRYNGIVEKERYCIIAVTVNFHNCERLNHFQHTFPDFLKPIWDEEIRSFLDVTTELSITHMSCIVVYHRRTIPIGFRQFSWVMQGVLHLDKPEDKRSEYIRASWITVHEFQRWHCNRQISIARIRTGIELCWGYQ